MTTNGAGPATERDPQGVPAPGAALLGDLLQTREVRQTLAAALPEVLRAWAGTSSIRRLVARVLSKLLPGGFATPAAGAAERSLRDVLREPGRARQVAAQLPALARGAGQLLTSVAQVATDARTAAPGRSPEALRPVVQAWLRSVDFAELKTAVDALAADGEEMAALVSDEMWQYPAKVTCLLSTIPAGVNAGVRASTRTVEPLNRLAPDLLADVVLALAREVQGEAIGQLVNEACELWRKIHTGSVLIGEQGRPQLPEDVAMLVADVLRTADVGLLLKARALLAETGEATDDAVCGLLEAHPELVREMLGARFRRAASASRRLARRADLVERALSEDEAATEIRASIGALDPQELGDTLSRLLALLNAVHAVDPDAVGGVLSQVVGALDRREVGRTTSWLVDDLVGALKPLAPEILPPLLRGMATLVAAHDAGVDQAVMVLRQAVASREEAA